MVTSTAGPALGKTLRQTVDVCARVCVSKLAPCGSKRELSFEYQQSLEHTQIVARRRRDAYFPAKDAHSVPDVKTRQQPYRETASERLPRNRDFSLSLARTIVAFLIEV